MADKLAVRLAALEASIGDVQAMAAAYRPHPNATLPAQAPLAAGSNNVLPKYFTSKYLVFGQRKDGQKDDKTVFANSNADKDDKSDGDAKAAGGAGGSVGATSVVSELAALHAAFKKIEDKTLASFFAKYDEVAPLLEGAADLKSVLLTGPQKRAIVQSAAKDLQATAKQLEAMQSLVTFIDRMPIANLSAVVKQLSALSALSEARSAAALQLHNEIDRFIDLYNAAIESVSRKFVELDATLSKWEAQVDAALTKHAAQLKHTK